MGKKTVRTELLEKIKALEQQNKELQEQKELLQQALLREKRVGAVNKQLADQYDNMFRMAAADMLLHPSPFPIHTTFENQGRDFHIAIANVVLFKAVGRTKTIYLKEAASPVDGGKPENVLYVGKPANFDLLLSSLVKNNDAIIRANRSCAINIEHYDLKEEKTFILKIDPPKGMADKLTRIKIDKLFDKAAYLKKQEERMHLHRYKNESLVTFNNNLAKK